MERLFHRRVQCNSIKFHVRAHSHQAKAKKNKWQTFAFACSEHGLSLVKSRRKAIHLNYISKAVLQTAVLKYAKKGKALCKYCVYLTGETRARLGSTGIQ